MTVHVTFSYRPESDCLVAYEMAVLLTQSLHGFPECLAIILRIERWCRLHSTLLKMMSKKCNCHNTITIMLKNTP